MLTRPSFLTALILVVALPATGCKKPANTPVPGSGQAPDTATTTEDAPGMAETPGATAPGAASGNAAPPAEKIPEDTEIVTLESGLKYSVLKAGPGEGNSPRLGERIKVHYTGWTTDGKRFDGSRGGPPAEFVAGRLIEGWNEALTMMKAGDHWKLTIPADIGYGERGSPPKIPPGATLIFEVELVAVFSMPDFRAPEPGKSKKTESGMTYEILAEGEGEPLEPTQSFDLEYAFHTPDGKIIDATASSGRTIIGNADRMNLKFLKEAPYLMKKGGEAVFEVPASLTFGEQRIHPDLAPGSPTIWRLKVLRVASPSPLPEFVLPPDDQMTRTTSGLKYQMLKEGTGEHTPPLGATVKVHYCGWLTDGKVFDSSYAVGFEAEFKVGSLIRGWNEGLRLMKKGSVYRFVIQPSLAYGPRGAPPTIPPNSTLVFHVEMLDFE
ncbi:MAG: FKBP-type peptidyl-prolyl cis-trans isomerase [Planctomycetota bacterium]